MHGHPIQHSRAYRRLPCHATLRPSAVQLVYTLSPASGHDKVQHPETAARITAIQRALEQYKMVENPQIVCQSPGSAPISELMPILQLVHPAAYLTRLQEICSSLNEPTMIDDSTYIAGGSFEACCETAAAVLDVLDAVLSQQQYQQQATMGFCLVRPPGHHVKATRPMGFGLFNFIAIAARYALQQPGINKVLIVDWDVHHGNGTEDIFYDTDAVLYISTHQQGLWPYTGKLTSIGAGAGKGSTINIPVPGDAGHGSMMRVWQEIIEPAAHSFQPDLILCSAGYDAHWADPLAGLQFESRTYHMLCKHTTTMARDLCQGRCMWILEGGYHLPSLSQSVANSFAGILGWPNLPDSQAALLREEPLAKLENTLTQIKRLHGRV